MHKAHQIQLIPTKSQVVLINKSLGCARHSYNWALAKWKELYEKGEKPTVYSMVKYQNSIKKTEMPFYSEVTKSAVQYAIHNLGQAYKNMWEGHSSYPKFKKKGIRDSYVAIEGEKCFKQKDFKIWLPRIGWVKCHENLRFDGNVKKVTIKRIADKYFASISIITNDLPSTSDSQAVVGIDLGIKMLITCSDGVVFENPKALKFNMKKLKRLQRDLSRKVNGSNNRQKSKSKLAKAYYKVSCVRKDAIHKATTYLVNNYKTIVMETLSTKSMLKNHKLSQSISDASFGEIKRQLDYKSSWNGVKLIMADRFFPSSKICSFCGNKKQGLKLSDRVYKCSNCHNTIDRDLNAAKNLANIALPQVLRDVKRVEQTQTLGLPNRVALNHEIYKNFELNLQNK